MTYARSSPRQAEDLAGRLGLPVYHAGLSRKEREQAQEAVDMLRRYAGLTDCRRRFLLEYFGQQYPDPCRNCDNSSGTRSWRLA